MNDGEFRLLPEGFLTESVVDEPIFTDVSNDGEVYTLYRIVRITHEADNHPDGWTHKANVAQVRQPRIGVALLLVTKRVITKVLVTLSQIHE